MNSKTTIASTKILPTASQGARAAINVETSVGVGVYANDTTSYCCGRLAPNLVAWFDETP